MRRFLVLVALAVMAFPVVVSAQIPTPKGITGSITTSGASDHEYVVSLQQLTSRNKTRPARFLSNFTVSDTCRIKFVSEKTDDNMKSGELSQIASADYHANEWIDLTADQVYNFQCNATSISLFIYGDARSVTFKGSVEYYD